jgi:hypothetical protein
MCEEAPSKDAHNIENHLHLTEVYQSARLDSNSIEAFSKGLKIRGGNAEIIAELRNYYLRKIPVITYLSRKNILNKYPGILLSRIGDR